MAIGPAFRGGRQLFRFQGAPQQMPFPETVIAPRIVSDLPERKVIRRFKPFTEGPEDLARRRASLPADFDLTPPDVQPIRRHVPKFTTRDPVTGQDISHSWTLRAPSRNQLDALVSEVEPITAATAVLSALQKAKTPEHLYPALLGLKTLREAYGPRKVAMATGRTSATSVTDGGAGAVARGAVRQEGFEDIDSVLSPDLLSAIDTEVWRAAYRVGIPESELGQWKEAFEAIGIKPSLPGKAEKTELSKLMNRITNIRSRGSKSPDEVAKNVAELDEIKARLLSGEFDEGGLRTALGQVEYAKGVVTGKSVTGLKYLNSNLVDNMPEGKMHAIFSHAIGTATTPDELVAIGVLARSRFKAFAFVDDIEAQVIERITPLEMIDVEILERMGRLTQARKDAITSNIPDVPRELSGAEVFARDFQLVAQKPGRVVPRSPYGEGFDRALPYAQSTEANMAIDWQRMGSSNIGRFGPGGEWRTAERYNKELGRTQQVVERWNNSTKKWETANVDPVLARKFTNPAPETPIERARFLMESTIVNHNLDGAVIVKNKIGRDPELVAANNRLVLEAVELIERMVKNGTITEGTTQFEWMHGVFGRILMNVSGRGYRIGGSGMVARDANSGRRAAALKALQKAEQAGMVPPEASSLIRATVPADDAYARALAGQTVKPRRGSRPRPAPVEQEFDNEADAIRALIAQYSKPSGGKS